MSGEKRFAVGLTDDEARRAYGDLLHYEETLVTIGACAYEEIMAVAVEAQLLPDPGRRPTPKEFKDIAGPMGRPQRTKEDPRGPLWIDGIPKELHKNGRRTHSLFDRRCKELPQLFAALRIHRNKWAHRTELTRATLCALAGTVLTVLELASDEWVEVGNLDDLQERAEGALSRAMADMADEPAALAKERDALLQEKQSLQERLEQATSASATANSGPRDVADIKSHVTKRANEVKGQVADMDAKVEGLRASVLALRDELTDSQELGEEPPDDDGDVGHERAHEAQLITGQKAREMLTKARRRMEQRGFDLKENVFQPWIVKDAILQASNGELQTIDDWWDLPAVRYKSKDPRIRDRMEEQLRIGECADWMIGVLARIEPRRNPLTPAANTAGDDLALS